MDELPVPLPAELSERVPYRLTIQRTNDGALLRIAAADGSTPLCIEFGPAGPVLRLGTGLGIAVDGELRFDARNVEIRAQESLKLESGSTLELASGADIVIDGTGDLTASAREHRLSARLGDVRVEANDDVRLTGERIRLNC
nr:MAG: hypothetical protein DIU78_19700 [Pseudomonadota bacterium]